MPPAASHISVIAPPKADAAQPDMQADIVTTPPFWPDFSIADFRDAARVDDTITAPRARHALQSAIETVLGDCEVWHLAHIVAGYPALDLVPALQIDNESRLILCFRRAVYAYAKAELIETYRDFDATGKGNRDEDWSDDTILQLRRDGKHAVRDLLGRPRLHSALI